NRSIPIWLGGFSEAAFRRAGHVGDGFIYAGDFDRCSVGLERVQHHLVSNGRDQAGFGHEMIMNRARSPQESADTARRWRDAGGTHASVVSMHQGFDSIDAHIEFFGTVKDLIG
ncbi:MAG: LLM class F420-dependent oxidoreductase, partial [Acidimicrobiales bacterium]